MLTGQKDALGSGERRTHISPQALVETRESELLALTLTADQTSR